jgi:hypothetical protein
MSNLKKIKQAGEQDLTDQNSSNEASNTYSGILGKRSKHDSSVDMLHEKLELSEDASDDPSNIGKRDKR